MMYIWDAHFFTLRAIYAISRTSFWVGPLWFSALQLTDTCICLCNPLRILIAEMCCVNTAAIDATNHV